MDGGRLDKDKAYFAREVAQPATIWRDRIFKFDKASLNDYWQKYLRTADDGEPKDNDRTAAKKYIDAECLSQVVIKEVEKIVREISEINDEDFKKFYPKDLTWPIVIYLKLI